jgi:uncharacterized protein DUF6152
MKMKVIIFLALISGLLMPAVPAFAHHGYAAYDMTVTRSLKGTITSYLMVNPHSQINLDVKGADGTVEHWIIEGLGVRGMKSGGFDFDSLKPGDEVTVTYSPAKSGAHAGVMQNVTMPDGKVIPKSSGGGNSN